MSQAEIAGGSLSTARQYPARGYRLRDFTLPSANGKMSSPSDYRGRSNLVLVFADRANSAVPLLSEIARDYTRLRGEEAQVLAVLRDTRDAVAQLAQKLPFPVLIDADGRAHRQFGAADEAGRPASAVYITDRYGEVFGSYRSAGGQALPKLEEMLDWLAFINSQCPECEPPEWPLETRGQEGVP